MNSKLRHVSCHGCKEHTPPPGCEDLQTANVFKRRDFFRVEEILRNLFYIYDICYMYKEVTLLLKALPKKISSPEEFAAKKLRVRIAIVTGSAQLGSAPVKIFNKDEPDPLCDEFLWLVHNISKDGAGSGSQHFSLVSRVTRLK